MKEIYLVRHAQSSANVSKDKSKNEAEEVAFDNMGSPLTSKGIEQILDPEDGLRIRLTDILGISPMDYDKPVVASEYVRPQQTAKVAGFEAIHIHPLLNEMDVKPELGGGRAITERHRQERWAPEEVLDRADKFLDNLADGSLDYELYFTHGMFIASVLMRCEVRKIETDATFDDDKRGFVPLQAGITKIYV